MVCLSKKYSLNCFSFDICNSLQSLSSLTIHVPFFATISPLYLITKIINNSKQNRSRAISDFLISS